MKHIIIPDTHNRIYNVTLAMAAPADQYIHLGDWFDDFADDLDALERTAKYLVRFANRNDTICLLGNHDAFYKFNINPVGLPKFEKRCEVVNSIVTPDIWDKFKIFEFVGDKLLSHAGFHPDMLSIRGYDEPGMRSQEYDALIYPNHYWHTIGKCRGGIKGTIGGPLWADWSEIKDITAGPQQIVGHTPDTHIRITQNTMCIDVPSIPYITIET